MGAVAPAVLDDVELDPVRAGRARAARQRRLNVVDVPRLRVLGFTFLAIGVLVHDQFVSPALGWSGWLRVTLVLEAYTAAAWLVLWACYERAKPLDLGLVFLALDLLMVDYGIYATGGDRSWIFFALCARVADQSHTSVRRALAFAHLAPLAYGVLLAWLALVEGRAIAPGPEAAKLAFVWALSLYIALTATIAERRRRRTAAAIRVARELIGELQAKSRQLEDARRRAEAASEAKSRFLATMSHELRTPLNAIIGFSQVLGGRTYGELTGEQAGFVQNILASGRQLLALVSDILDHAKVEAGRFELHASRFDATSALEEVVATLLPLAREKALRVTLDVEPRPSPIEADARSFTQVALNLVGNAIKFTPPQGRITVSARTTAPSPAAASVLRVSVADSGVGVRPEDRARIFEAFEQVDSSASRTRPGTGLGLALSRQLVELHGGRLWVESDGIAGRGSVFVFEIPVARSPVSDR